MCSLVPLFENRNQYNHIVFSCYLAFQVVLDCFLQLFLCICTYVCCICIHVCTCVCRHPCTQGQVEVRGCPRMPSSIAATPYILKTGISLNLKLTDLARLPWDLPTSIPQCSCTENHYAWLLCRGWRSEL